MVDHAPYRFFLKPWPETAKIQFVLGEQVHVWYDNWLGWQLAAIVGFHDDNVKLHVSNVQHCGVSSALVLPRDSNRLAPAFTQDNPLCRKKNHYADLVD